MSETDLELVEGGAGTDLELVEGGAGTDLELVEGGAGVGVPVVVAALPWQLGRERREHVVKCPRQDHVVVAVQKEHDHCGGKANS